MNSFVRIVVVVLLINFGSGNFYKNKAKNNSRVVENFENIIKNFTHSKTFDKKSKIELLQDDPENEVEIQSETKFDNPEKPKRKMVKLNMKQGLTINQILDVYSLKNAGDELCRNHSLEFGDGLRSFEPWALKSKTLSCVKGTLYAAVIVGLLFP